jgi:hypothetical protein
VRWLTEQPPLSAVLLTVAASIFVGLLIAWVTARAWGGAAEGIDDVIDALLLLPIPHLV